MHLEESVAILQTMMKEEADMYVNFPVNRRREQQNQRPIPTSEQARRSGDFMLHSALCLMRYGIAIVLKRHHPASLKDLYFGTMEFLRQQGAYEKTPEAYEMAEKIWQSSKKLFPEIAHPPVFHVVQEAHRRLADYLPIEDDREEGEDA